jgi:putative nucleotidyltransferase with HDIG domain
MGHVGAVADLSLVIADKMGREGAEVDKKVLQAGGLLHDIGITKTPVKSEDEEFQNPHPEHCTIGAEMILGLGYPREVAECAQGHERWSVEAAREIGLPNPAVGNDYLPHCVEAQLVAFADVAVYSVVEVGADYLNPWKDARAFAKAMLPYVRACYKRINKEVTVDHPVCVNASANQEMFLKYVKIDDFPKPWRGMATMDVSMYKKYFG